MRQVGAVLLIALWTGLLVVGGHGPVQAASAEIVIVHTNDTHARLEPIEVDGEPRGGYSRLAGFVRVLRELYPGRVLWLDAGDTTHGTNIANVFGGRPVVDALNAAGLDAMAVGNHDFNYGQEALKANMDAAEFAVLSANVVYAATGEPFAQESTVFELDGLRVAVFGLTTPTTPVSTHPKNVQGLTFQDPVTVAARLVPALEEQADLVIALTHIGVEEDVRLAGSVPGIDVIVGGHSHTRLDEPMLVGDTVIVQDYEYGQFLGFLKLTVEDGRVVGYSGNLLPIVASAPVDGAVQSIIDGWASQLDERLDEIVGTTLVDLDGERANVRTEETNLGNLIADVLREAVGAEIAFHNGGGIRASIPAGPIALRDVYTVLPFDNTLVGLELTGAQVLEVLEHSVAAYPEQFGGFLQVSGLSFSFDPNRPPGQRVGDVTVGGEPLELDRIYRVATNDFLAAGGDGYSMLTDAPMFFGSMEAGGQFLRDVFADHLRERGSVAPELEGRIRVIE